MQGATQITSPPTATAVVLARTPGATTRSDLMSMGQSLTFARSTVPGGAPGLNEGRTVILPHPAIFCVENRDA